MLLARLFDYVPLDVSLVGFVFDAKSPADGNHINHSAVDSRLSVVKKVSLTRREKLVMHFVARGMTNSDIASELNLSESTVKAHVSRVIRKLGVKNRWAAARLSFE